MRISVALCTYNGEQFIREQIDSILNQSLPVDEIVICDDGSIDKTVEIVKEYSSLNLGLFKIHINEVNLRSVKNFEKAISLCSGDIIFLSDQDDIWVSNKVEDYINYFNQNGNISVLGSNGYCINEKGKIQDKYAIWDIPQFLRDKNVLFNYHFIISYVANISTGASMAFRKSFILEIMPFPEIKNLHHDEWIALISSKINKFELLNKKYFYYRIHNNQQIGGVFYSKTNEQKKRLIQLFDYNCENSKFLILKKRLKKIVHFYKLNKELIDLNVYNNQDLEDNLKKTAQFYNHTKIIIAKKYPVKMFLLNLADLILKKRKINSE